MENDVACQMVGIRTVWIKMFDGVIRDLTYVRYAPQMKKNIISVGVMDSKGLKITMENGILKITKGFMVIMKGERDRNLYYLKVNTVTCALTASVESDDDTTKL